MQNVTKLSKLFKILLLFSLVSMPAEFLFFLFWGVGVAHIIRYCLYSAGIWDKGFKLNLCTLD